MSKLIVDKCDLKIGDKVEFSWYDAMIIVETLNQQNYKGHNNWRIPTKDELNYLYENKQKIGGFSSYLYWSSTEYDATKVWRQSLVDEYQYANGYYFKSYNGLQVRCVRSI